MTTTFIANLDLKDSAQMERPYAKTYCAGDNPEEALSDAERRIDRDETVRSVEPLQPILDGIIAGIAAGRRYSIGWKHEGRFGPVTITDVDAFEAENPPRADGARVVGVPFGSDPSWETSLPWSTRAEAARLAKYLGLRLEDS